MKTVIVDAVGEPCPIPVVKATKALREMGEPGTLEVRVDNDWALALRIYMEVKQMMLFFMITVSELRQIITGVLTEAFQTVCLSDCVQ